MSLKPAQPTMMWAAIYQSTRSEWIVFDTVRKRRSDAKAAYLSNYDPKYHARVLGRVRFARVVVSLGGAQEGADR